jgi:pimeloyl-ACP methyl ester carboxylesterase
MSIDDCVAKLTFDIDKISKETQCNKFILIGHSMGGLMAAKYAAHNNNISKVITVASPWRGAPLAKARPGIRFSEMTVGSNYLIELQNECFMKNVNIFSISSYYDWAVPKNYGDYINNVYKFTYYGHYLIIVSPFVWKKIFSILRY